MVSSPGRCWRADPEAVAPLSGQGRPPSSARHRRRQSRARRGDGAGVDRVAAAESHRPSWRLALAAALVSLLAGGLCPLFGPNLRPIPLPDQQQPATKLALARFELDLSPEVAWRNPYARGGLGLELADLSPDGRRSSIREAGDFIFVAWMSSIRHRFAARKVAWLPSLARRRVGGILHGNEAAEGLDPDRSRRADRRCLGRNHRHLGARRHHRLRNRRDLRASGGCTPPEENRAQ